MCCRTKSGGRQALRVMNTNTGELKELNCKAWICPECGELKKKRMYVGMRDFFSRFKYRVMLTFSLSSRGVDAITHAKLISKAFSQFIKNLRRNKNLNEQTRNLKYVKVAEFHKSGYVHLHVIINQFAPVRKLQQLWEAAILYAGYTPERDKFCNVNFSKRHSAESAADYVCKYVLKAAKEINNLINSWSKSKSTPIFTKYIATDKWKLVLLLNTGQIKELYTCNELSAKVPELTTDYNKTFEILCIREADK